MATDPSPSTQRLASALNALRPDWPIASLATLLTHPTLRNRAHPDLAIAAVRLALDPATRTPGQLLHHGPWWLSTQPTSSDADRHPSAVPISALTLDVPEPADPAPHLADMRQHLARVKHRQSAGH